MIFHPKKLKKGGIFQGFEPKTGPDLRNRLKLRKLNLFKIGQNYVPEKNLGSAFDINFSYFGQKRSKKEGAGMVLASAVKWAKMAADYENGRNSKICFAPLRAHHVAI